MNKRKGLSTKISPNDQSLINYVYYNYDAAEIETIKFTFVPGFTYLKGARAGEIHLKSSQHNESLENVRTSNPNQNDPNNVTINFFDTGTLSSITSNLQYVSDEQGHYYTVKKTIQKKAVLELFQMQLCQHLPEEKIVSRLLQQQKNNHSEKTKNTKNMQKVQPIFCKICNQRLFYFYLPDQQVITLKDVLKQIDLDDENQEIPKIQWNIMLGQTFTKTTCIAKFQDKEFFLDVNGKISFLVPWTEVENNKKQGKVLKYKPIYCQHQKIESNTCQYCFQEVDPFQLNLKKFLFQIEEEDNFKREMITTGSTLTEQENKFVDNLLEKQRGILILDLDNTVLHSIELNQIHESKLKDFDEFYEIKVGSNIQYNQEIGLHYVTTCFIVKMRPYFKDFIETVIRFYEIYVYTKGTRMYAQQICNAIRNQYGSKDYPTLNKNTKIEYFTFLKDKNAFTSSRIITRDEDPDLDRKSLNNILPTRQQNLMVMDDLRNVWNYSPAVLRTVPYRFFFKTKHLQAMNEKQNSKIEKINGKALDQSRQGKKLEPVEDLHAQNLEPVRELPCDHFDREVAELENSINDPSGMKGPQDKSYIKRPQNEENSKQILKLGYKEQLKPELIVAEISDQNNSVKIVDIKKELVPEDKQYEYDILPRSDFFLIYASWNLARIHSRFYAERKEKKFDGKELSFSQIHTKIKSQILEGTVVKMCMKNDKKIDTYDRAINVGCKVLQADSSATPQYVIRLNDLKSNAERMYFKKEQSKERKSILKQQANIEIETIKQLKSYAQTLKIPIVSESWIRFCYYFTYRFPVEPFVIDSEHLLEEIHEKDFKWVIEEHGKKLLEKLRKENEEYLLIKEKKGQGQ